jgi:hypothetical protein
MANERAWFLYNGAPSGEQAFTNYFYLPLTCQVNGELICAVKGIYDYETYGNHPVPFSLDPQLSDYIIGALAANGISTDSCF